MKQIKKKMYVAPIVEVMEARVEKGFAGSGCQLTATPEPISQFENIGNGTLVYL